MKQLPCNVVVNISLKLWVEGGGEGVLVILELVGGGRSVITILLRKVMYKLFYVSHLKVLLQVYCYSLDLSLGGGAIHCRTHFTKLLSERSEVLFQRRPFGILYFTALLYNEVKLENVKNPICF